MKIRKGTNRLPLIIILISLAVSIFYNIKLQEQIDKRDIIIEKLTRVEMCRAWRFGN